MVDRLTPEDRSALMSRIRSKNTAPELVVRRLLHRAGFRFRLHAKELPGKPDIVFRPRRKVIRVQGCYWHGHGCARGGTGAKSNADYWGPKIGKNRARDCANLDALVAAGWAVLTIWECETRDPSLLEPKLEAFLKPEPLTIRPKIDGPS
jgi:DNA mismatch endonuclease (patch repair protein)